MNKALCILIILLFLPACGVKESEQTVTNRARTNHTVLAQEQPEDKTVSQKKIEKLVAKLANPGTNDSALKELLEIGKAASKHLIAILGNPNASMRYGAAMALGELKDNKAVEPLIGILDDPEALVRWVVVRALASIGDKRALEPTRKKLSDKSALVRVAAINLLGELGDKEAIKIITKALKDNEESVRTAAAKALGELGDTNAVGALIELLKDKSRDVKLQAAFALGKLKAAKAVDQLVKLLKDPDPHVRGVSAQALADIGDEKAAKPLLDVLENLDKWGRKSAMDLFSQVSYKEALPVVIKLLLTDKDKDIRESAALALKYWKNLDATAVQPLIQALHDKWVQHTAAGALVNIGKPGLPILKKGLISEQDEYVKMLLESVIYEIKDK